MNTRFAKYEAYFGRAADFTLEARPGATPAVSVGRFSAVSAGFLRRLVIPVHDNIVYVTHGMSCQPMQVPESEKQIYPSTIELITCCKRYYCGGEPDGTDMVATMLQALAALPFETGMFFGPMHTAVLEERLATNSEMSAFLFALPDGINMSRLCSCTPAAQLVVSVMPITTAERTFATQNGSEKLVALFQKQRVPNLFDPFRGSVV